MKTCDVQFVGSSYGTYSYFIPEDMKLKLDDYVIVVVNDEPKTAKVYSLTGANAHKATEAIAGKVDLTAYHTHVAAVKKKAELLKRLAKLEKEESEFIRFELLAERNPEARKLLEELKTL